MFIRFEMETKFSTVELKNSEVSRINAEIKNYFKDLILNFRNI